MGDAQRTLIPEMGYAQPGSKQSAMSSDRFDVFPAVREAAKALTPSRDVANVSVATVPRYLAERPRLTVGRTSR